MAGHYPLNRLPFAANGQAPTAPPAGAADAAAADPHALVPIPTWARINVVAEAGTRFRYIDHQNGLVTICVRERHALDWPHGTPPLQPGQQDVELPLSGGQFFVANNLFQPVDHPFQASTLDPSLCRTCLLPSRQRWLVESFRAGADGAEPARQVAWFDDHSEALVERARLALQEDIVAVGLRRATFRDEGPDRGD